MFGVFFYQDGCQVMQYMHCAFCKMQLAFELQLTNLQRCSKNRLPKTYEKASYA